MAKIKATPLIGGAGLWRWDQSSRKSPLTRNPCFLIFWFSRLRRIGVLAKKTSKNQITLPKAVVSEFEGVDYFEVFAEDGRIILEPVRTGQADAVRSKLESLGIRESDVDAAVRYARGVGDAGKKKRKK